MRKLVLYSDQIEPETDPVDQALLALLGKPHATVGYIPARADPERTYYEGRRAYYDRLGMRMSTYFELDDAYEPDRLDELLACDAIHLSGGNTYTFLHWLRKRRLLAPLRDYVARGGVLIGVSAGSILMTPEISISALYGDTPVEGDTDPFALHLVDFIFAPHLDAIRAGLAPLQAISRTRHQVLYACRDSGGVVVDDGQVTCVGDVTVIDNGEIVPPLHGTGSGS